VVLLERAERAHPEVLALITAVSSSQAHRVPYVALNLRRLIEALHRACQFVALSALRDHILTLLPLYVLSCQVLESGELRDAMGRRCDFRNALLLLTTSPTGQPLPGSLAGGGPCLAAAAASPGHSSGEHVHAEASATSGSSSASSHHSAAAQGLQQEAEHGRVGGSGSSSRGSAGGAGVNPAVHPARLLPGELLSRLDSVVSMQPLSQADMRQIVELQLADVQAALQQQGITLSMHSAACDWLAKHGASVEAGARRLQPVLREQLLLPAAECLLANQAGGTAAGAETQLGVHVAADGSKLVVCGMSAGIDIDAGP
jgi:hypothetical protein